MMKQLFIKSYAICCPDADLLAPFALRGHDIDNSLMPAAMRRRTSMTTRMAISAATLACVQANVHSQTLASVFASLGGEIQVTDALCRLLPDENELLSPTQFHNSVHNTSAGYWAILNQCQAPSTAIAAADDTFAMGLIEVWAQLQQQGCGERLLVCYDELWPQYLAPPIGQNAFACAFVFSTQAEQAIGSISLPQISESAEQILPAEWLKLTESAPAAAVIPLLMTLQAKTPATVPLNIKAPIWSSRVSVREFKHGQ
ncbi:MAG: beta-ketoacyl synthase chain length factor [Methyloprofundus sp.]|nr:beta-ketoacyl synthase chain length factor [Methyloprofundus sp.]MDT8426843.1 beta-ketoacyl synthase chain length factor [Methyloprofundus sp.]